MRTVARSLLGVPTRSPLGVLNTGVISGGPMLYIGDYSSVRMEEICRDYNVEYTFLRFPDEDPPNWDDFDTIFFAQTWNVWSGHQDSSIWDRIEPVVDAVDAGWEGRLVLAAGYSNVTYWLGAGVINRAFDYTGLAFMPYVTGIKHTFPYNPEIYAGTMFDGPSYKGTDARHTRVVAVEECDLTAGVSGLYSTYVCNIIGGEGDHSVTNIAYTSQEPSLPWIVRKTISGVDFVWVGNNFIFEWGAPYDVPACTRFIRNLLTVPIP